MPLLLPTPPYSSLTPPLTPCTPWTSLRPERFRVLTLFTRSPKSQEPIRESRLWCVVHSSTPPTRPLQSFWYSIGTQSVCIVRLADFAANSPPLTATSHQPLAVSLSSTVFKLNERTVRGAWCVVHGWRSIAPEGVGNNIHSTWLRVDWDERDRSWSN
jgi:hypothetical protein